MDLVVKILIGLVAFIHCYILWLEMIVWEQRGPKVFKSIPKEQFPKTKIMAANQGLYNGFLAAGLIWTFFIDNSIWRVNVSIFFLSCVAIAGLFGAVTASKRIFFVQALPAIVTLVLILVT